MCVPYLCAWGTFTTRLETSCSLRASSSGTRPKVHNQAMVAAASGVDAVLSPHCAAKQEAAPDKAAAGVSASPTTADYLTPGRSGRCWACPGLQRMSRRSWDALAGGLVRFLLRAVLLGKVRPSRTGRPPEAEPLIPMVVVHR